jgi:hypothetical protein
MVAKNPKPNWWRLYALLPLLTALLVGADLLAPSAGWRTLAECAASLVIIGAIALWVRTNRVALALRDDPSHGGTAVHAWVAYCPPAGFRRRLDLPEATPILHQAARTEPIQEDVACCAK